jgi:hypothetical protein
LLPFVLGAAKGRFPPLAHLGPPTKCSAQSGRSTTKNAAERRYSLLPFHSFSNIDLHLDHDLGEAVSKTQAPSRKRPLSH